MFRCWSPVYFEEENSSPYDEFDPLKEWFVHPDHVELQNPSDLSNTCLDLHEFQYSEIKREEKDQIFESSIDVKMEKISLVEISDGGKVERGLEENDGRSEGDMKCVRLGLEDLKSDLPNKEEIFEVESDEKGSMSIESDSDVGDSSSDESSSDESITVTKSLSSSEDEDDVGIGMREEAEAFEEGEVREFDSHEIDFLSDEEAEGPKGSIRSKHEVEDLPPVPMVEVTLQPNHELLSVGVISSIMSNRVIVEGSVLHNPLNEGSILWVTDTRLPLGLVDEIFGPVKNPYYVVRYNTEEDVPGGILVGIAISFVAEFSTKILNDKELYKKGYDASGENDEEVDNEAEFSDDEKEAEHKKSLWVGKRVIKPCKGVKQEARFEKKRTSFMGPRAQHYDIQTQVTCAPLSIDQQHSTGAVPSQTAPLMDQSGVKQEARFESKWNSFMGPKAQHRDIQKHVTCAQISIDQQHYTGPVQSQPAHLMDQSGIGPGSWSSSFSVTNADSIPPPTLRQFPQAVQAVNYLGNPSQQLLTHHQNSPWPPGFSPQLQNTGLQDNFPMQLQNQNVVLNNLVNMMAFQQLLQQFVPHQGSSLPWVGAAPSLQPLGQNNFASSPFSNGFINNLPGTPGLANEQIQGQTPLPLPPSMQFNAGISTLQSNGGHSWPRGRRPYQRGGGRFFDRGGRQPNR